MITTVKVVNLIYHFLFFRYRRKRYVLYYTQLQINIKLNTIIPKILRLNLHRNFYILILAKLTNF